MKFTFEADMVKGQCFRCPLLQLIVSGGGCALGGFATIDGVEPDECPLKEES